MLMALTTGCASIVHGTRQDVVITSTPPDAKVAIYRQTSASMPAGSAEAATPEEQSKRVLYTRTITPGTVSLERNNHYAVVYEKDGYGGREVPLSPVVDGWIAGNIVFGGLIGITIDLINGAAYHLSPTPVDITLQAAPAEKPTTLSPQADMAPAPVSTMAAVASHADRTRTSVQVNARYVRVPLLSMPDLQAERVEGLSAGRTLSVLEDRGTWLQIETPEGQRGWILQQWVEH
jgi:hypothetical protein